MCKGQIHKSREKTTGCQRLRGGKMGRCRSKGTEFSYAGTKVWRS